MNLCPFCRWPVWPWQRKVNAGWEGDPSTTEAHEVCLEATREAGATAYRVRLNRNPGWVLNFDTLTGLPVFLHRSCERARWCVTCCPCGTSVPEDLTGRDWPQRYP